jgi:hypothetical protein
VAGAGGDHHVTGFVNLASHLERGGSGDAEYQMGGDAAGVGGEGVGAVGGREAAQ